MEKQFTPGNSLKKITYISNMLNTKNMTSCNSQKTQTETTWTCSETTWFNRKRKPMNYLFENVYKWLPSISKRFWITNHKSKTSANQKMSHYILDCFITINAVHRTQVNECAWAGWMSEHSVKEMVWTLYKL